MYMPKTANHVRVNNNLLYIASSKMQNHLWCKAASCPMVYSLIVIVIPSASNEMKGGEPYHVNEWINHLTIDYE